MKRIMMGVYGFFDSDDSRCGDWVLPAMEKVMVEGNGGGTQDRKRDGSCSFYTTHGNYHNPMTMAKQQSRDRKKDGSCKS